MYKCGVVTDFISGPPARDGEGARLPGSVEFLGAPMHPWTMTQTVDEIRRRVSDDCFTQHVVVNVAKIVSMREDPSLRDAVRQCDIINVDGMVVVWGARFLGYSVPERVAGIDLFHALLEMSASEDYGVFFLGAKPAVLDKAVENAVAQNPGLRVVGRHHGYFEDGSAEERRIVEAIGDSGAKLLFVGISSPKKELFIERNRERLGVCFVMGVGGTFDVVAGKVQRAPVWMQSAGLEWLFRLLQEPRRMWRRYLGTNLRFAWLLMRARVSSNNL